jgi:phage shock protein A
LTPIGTLGKEYGRARILTERNEQGLEKQSTVRARKSVARAKQDDDGHTVKSSDGEGLDAIKKRIAELEADNKGLRQQFVTMSSRPAEPSRSSEESVRQQRHNFFKYSNTKRY